MACVRLVVRGRVQGVGFRYFVVRWAEAHGVAGWVRNCADGAVEVEAEGPQALLERFVEALRRGPSAARVTGLEQQWTDRLPGHRGFRVTG